MKLLRILVLTKRQYTGKDLLDDCYGRMFEIPECLAALGHNVKGVTLSYRKKEEGIFRPRLVEWESLNVSPFSFFNINKYFKRLRAILSVFQPDLIWASSDVLHAVAAWKMSRRFDSPYVVDLYDNYESFGLAKLPGATSLLRKSCREARGLTVVSHALKNYVISNYRLKNQPIEVIGNAVDNNVFHPYSKTLARNTLGLPHAAPLIGTAGALSSTRGIEILFQAFSGLSKKHPNLRLVIAGPRDGTIARYLLEPGIIDLGVLPLSQIPFVFSALDVAVICNKDSSFGRYCYPQKFQEIVACNTPIVASNVGEMSHLLAQHPQLLFPPDNTSSLVERIEYQLEHSELLGIKPLSWSDRADSLSSFFHSILFGKT